jgi:hypothetical protein
MAESIGYLEKQQASDGHAFGEIDPSGEAVYPHLQFPAGAYDRRKPSAGGHACQQELWIELANLVFYRNEE